jgi:DNA primase
MNQITPAEQLVIDKVSIIDYYNKHIVSLNNKLRPDVPFRPMSEGKITGICPFHSDTDPSFHYWQKKNIFYCFGCGTGGDVIRLHQGIRRLYYNENLNRVSAVKSLALLYGIELPEELVIDKTNVFQRAKDLISNPSHYEIPKNLMSYAEFRSLNTKVINNSTMPLEVKIREFANLDRMASLVISGDYK